MSTIPAIDLLEPRIFADKFVDYKLQEDKQYTMKTVDFCALATDLPELIREQAK